MRLLRPLLLFLLLATVYFTALFALGPRGSYPHWFRGGANAVFGSMGANRVASFEPFDDPLGTHDTRMSIGLRHSGYPKSLGLNSVRQGYTPAALLVALVLATPVPWPRRGRALLIGLVLVHGFIALRLWVSLLWGFSLVQFGGKPMLELSGLGSWLVRRADQLLAGNLYITYLVPAMIWLVLTVRPEDLRALQETPHDVERDAPATLPEAGVSPRP
jgi:hypothetical protein